MKKIIGLIAIAVVFLPVSVWAKVYSFDCKDSKVQGSIKYAVIGSYNGSFDVCQGKIGYDPVQQRVESVDLQIKVRSVHSQCPWCDKLAVSRRLLNPNVYPFISFKSHEFEKRSAHEYLVKGVITMHGVARSIKSGFTLHEEDQGGLYLKGDWVLRRKDFNIVWNKALDHGGVVVGEDMTVSWKVKAHPE
jgi:polyisoprenoid-binding protein YceI